MSEKIEPTTHQTGSCALVILAIALCVVLFSGDPDISDLLREWLLQTVRGR